MAGKLRSANSSGLDSNFAVLEGDKVFGRPSEWSGPVPADVESGLGGLSGIRAPCIVPLILCKQGQSAPCPTTFKTLV